MSGEEVHMNKKNFFIAILSLVLALVVILSLRAIGIIDQNVGTILLAVLDVALLFLWFFDRLLLPYLQEKKREKVQGPDPIIY